MKKKRFAFMFTALFTVALLGACGKTEEKAEIITDTEDTTVISDSSSEVVETENNLKDDGYFKEVVTEGTDPKVKDIVSYQTEYKDDKWENISLNVDHIKIVNVTDFKDSEDIEYKELVSLKYRLTNEDSKDREITPKKATLILHDRKKVNAEVFLDYIDDEVLTKDKHKDGYIHFKVKDENELNEIESVHVTFKAKDEEKEIEHTYEIDLPLDAK